MFNFRKRASLEISIQAIVIVVLAMTLLGLGLGFVKGMFKNIIGIQESVSDQVKEQILEDLRTGDKKISFPRSEVKIGKGEAIVLGVGVKNKNDAQLPHTIMFDSISGPDGSTVDVDKWFQYSSSESTLEPSEAVVKNIRLSVPPDAPSGSYLFSFKVKSDQDVYAEKDFFVVVTG